MKRRKGPKPSRPPVVAKPPVPVAKAASVAEPIVRRCGACEFHVNGRCHRFPPIPLLSAGCVQPEVQPDGWCGEFKAA